MAVTSASPKDETPFEKIREDHPHMWVAVLVTKRDENGQPIAGKFVAEDPDRYRLRDQVIQYNDICIFFAGDPPYPLFL
jgi:hypothetical protein